MALGFLDEQTILYYPPAFDATSLSRLQDVVEDAIPVGDVDANEYFACNNLVVDRTVLLDGCTVELERTLTARGYQIECCDMSEFKKSGGSLRCLVLTFLDQPSGAVETAG
jgi:N-dimethylarginine dimethylaminohydrolase